VVLDIPGDLPLILVDATLIVQIIANLLDNAGKYTPPQTTVSISARRRNGGVLLVVEDDGPGLPPGDPDRLFEKFQRGRAEGNIVGVGLGLAICRAAARIHQGDIRAANGTNGGARFEITLPDGAMPDSPAVG
jgi:two-component system sensor histidine kinase KdpD